LPKIQAFARPGLRRFVAFCGNFGNAKPALVQKTRFAGALSLRWISFGAFFALGKRGTLRPWRLEAAPAAQAAKPARVR
jgi:hypothetical protein